MILKWAYRSEEGVKLKLFLIITKANRKGFLGKNEQKINIFLETIIYTNFMVFY